MTAPDFFEGLDNDDEFLRLEEPSSSKKQPLSLQNNPTKRASIDAIPDFFESIDIEQPSDQMRSSSQGTPNFFDEMDDSDVSNQQEPSIWERAKNYFTSGKLGEAASLQMRSGGFAGAPTLTPEQAKRVGTEFATIAAVEAAFAPVLGYAAASQIAPGILTALTRLTQAATTGAATATTSKLVEEGELPSQEELLEHGVTWMAIDAGLQALHAGAVGGKYAYDFGAAVNKIAKEEKVPATKVLSKLWDSTVNYIKTRFGRPINAPQDITIEDVAILVDKAKQAEKEGLQEALEVEPIKVEKPQKPKAPEEAEIEKPEALKPEEEIKTKTPQQIEAKEPREEEPIGGKTSFTTSKGSTYTVNPDGTTTRAKAARLEHGGDEGIQPTSENTWYLTPEDSMKLGEFQARGENKKIVELPNGQLGVQYLTGKDKGKIEQRTIVDFSKEPKEGMIPVESWQNGERIHFGNEITKVEKPKGEAKVIDERAILKDIMDLKDELSKTNGTTRAIQQKKQELADAIREKARELKKVREQNKSLEQPTFKKVERPDITPKGLKKQKDYILDKIDDAIANPHDTNQIVIDVPGDGEFKINNEPRILESARDKIEKGWPVRQLKTKSPTVLRKEEGAGVLKSRLPEEGAMGEELPKRPTQIPPWQTRPRQPVVGKKQAVARSKIIELFRTAFTDPIRLGKISQRNAVGIHKLWPKVTRLLRDNDIETVAHEIGHNLHTTLYGGDAKTPQEQAHNISNALRPYLDELKPLAHYEPWGMEDFAEFTRLYVTNPDVAKELAPKFYDKFENDMRAEYPEMLNALLEAREYYDAYLQGTPQSRIRAQTSYASDKGKLANIIEAVKKKFHPDKLKTEFLDDVFPAKRLVAEAFGIPLSEVENLKDERNLYRALRVLKGAVGKGDVFVLHETFNAKTLDKINGSLKDILKQLPNEEAYREFNDYLIARRALEKTAQNVETGINAGDALAVEQELRPKYGELAQQLDKYNDALLKYALDAGLLSREQYVMIKKNNVLYTPFQRVMEPEKGGVAAGGGRLQAGKPIKRMKGSTRDIIAPVESILKNTYSIIINAEKNLAGQVLANIAKTKKDIGTYVEHVPTPIKVKGKIEGEQVAKELAKRFEREGLSDLIEYDQDGKPVLREDIADAIPEVFLRFGAGQYPAGENIVTVYFEGKPKYYQVSPEIFEMWNKGIAPYTAGLLTKILRIPARTLRAGAILNPKFIQKNVIRDTWGSWLFTKYGKGLKAPVSLFIDTIYSPLSMLATAAVKGGLYVEWLKSGGGMSTMQSLDRNNVTKKLNEVRGKWQGIQPIKWLRQAAEISEEVNRLSEFGKALAVEGKTRLGREIAAFAARDLSIDFAKMGLQTKALNQIIPFWNATVQGGDKLLRTMANPQDRKNFIPRIIGFIVLPSLMLAWLNKDDERVKEFYEEEKDFNFITFIGDKAIKIPVPFETGVLAHGLTQRMFNHFMKKDPEAFEKFMGSILSAMSPNFIPAFANPVIEAYANKNFFTGARIVPMGQEGLISKYQYKRTTSVTARLLGRAMAYMLGQETRSKAASPAIIDHFINAWGSGLGRQMINISDASLEAAGLSDKIPGPNQAITEKYELDAFTARYPRASTRSIEKFYDNYADARARKKSLKHAEKMELATKEEQEAAYQRFEKIYDYNTLQHAYKAMQNCQREINNIWNDPSIDPKLKKQFIDDLYLEMIQFAKDANEDI